MCPCCCDPDGVVKPDLDTMRDCSCSASDAEFGIEGALAFFAGALDRWRVLADFLARAPKL